MQSPTDCSKCGKNAFFFHKSSGRQLCQDCFISYFERKFQKIISKYNILDSKDVVCIALSGGKDSIAMLYNLFLRQQKTNSPKLIAVTVNEGISDTYVHNLAHIKEFFAKTHINIPLIETSYTDIFGLSMDEIVQKIHGLRLQVNACTVCASIRRRIINEVARQNGASKIAIGHNLDDLAQTLLMNVLRKDLEKITHSFPYTSSYRTTPLLLPRIKPLFLFTEEEILNYCEVKSLPYFSKTCQYSLNFPILRKKIQSFLNNLDERNYEFKYNLIQFHLEINQKLAKTNAQSSLINYCSKCSYPTGLNRKICTYCEFKRIFTNS